MNYPAIANALAALAAVMGLLIAVGAVPLAAPFVGGALVLLALAVIAR